jgi:hypothetical protein
MEFRLVYQGPLPSASAASPKPKAQHAIRKQLHLQLEQYWKEHPHLKHFLVAGDLGGVPLGDPRNVVTRLAKTFDHGGHGFVPLVREQEDMYCSLNILFLRRDRPGRIVSGGGDLDNRLKTLMDALRIPDKTSGLPDQPEPGFNPIFCLLQDDAQVTSLHVTTDRILAPLEPNQRETDVVLIIHVHIYRGTNVAQVTGLPGNVGAA